jgi:hypothetical protein
MEEMFSSFFILATSNMTTDLFEKCVVVYAFFLLHLKLLSKGTEVHERVFFIVLFRTTRTRKYNAILRRTLRIKKERNKKCTVLQYKKKVHSAVSQLIFLKESFGTMLPTSNGHAKSNGRVSPMDENTIKQLAKQETDNTNVLVTDDPVKTTATIVQKSWIYRLFEKDQKEEEKEVEAKVEVKKKPEGPKLKTFEIVCCFQLKSIIFIVMSSFSV